MITKGTKQQMTYRYLACLTILTICSLKQHESEYI